MRKIYVHKDFTRVGYYKSILDDAGIPNFILNGSTHNVMTSIPIPLFYPTLYVLDDSGYEAAMQLLGEIHDAPGSSEPDRLCPECSAVVPATFGSCWHCGQELPPASAPGGAGEQ